MKKLLTKSYYNLSSLIIFIVVVIFLIIFTPNHLFIDSNNLASLGKLTPILGILTLGIGILMICGEFDLSISSVIPLCSFIFVKFLINDINPLIALMILLPIGAIIGAMNGVIVSKTKLPSFIITLCTMMFWKGFIFSISRKTPISIIDYVNKYQFFKNILIGEIGILPMQTIWFVFFAVVVGIVLHFHKFGNWIFATGGNEDSARAMGINTDIVKIICYAFIGVLCAFVSVLQAVSFGAFGATQGVGFEIQAIAAVIVGGVSLRGGKGNILNIILGVLIIKVIANGLILMRVPVFGIDTFIGLSVLIFAMISNFYRKVSNF